MPQFCDRAAAAAALLIGINYLSDTTDSAGAPSTIKVAQTDHQVERSNTTSSNAGAALPTAKLASTASSSGGGDVSFGTGQGLLEPRQRQDWTSQPSWAKPLSYELLTSTGVGKLVGRLRFHGAEAVKAPAGELVRAWKDMILATR